MYGLQDEKWVIKKMLILFFPTKLILVFLQLSKGLTAEMSPVNNIYLVISAGFLLSLSRLDLWLPVKQGVVSSLVTLLRRHRVTCRKVPLCCRFPSRLIQRGQLCSEGRLSLNFFAGPSHRKGKQKRDFYSITQFCELCQYIRNVTMFVLQTRILFLPKRKHQNLIM